MSESLLFRLQRGKVRLLEDVVESWKLAHAKAMLAWDLEDLVRFSLALLDDLRAFWERTWQRLAEGESQDFQKTGEFLKDLFQRSAGLLEVVRDHARQFEQDTGHRIADLAKLNDAISQLRHLHDRVVENWPWDTRPWSAINRTMIEESRASGARGEGEEASAILERLRSGGSLCKD